MATSLYGFKRRIDKFTKDKATNGCEPQWLCSSSSVRGILHQNTSCWGLSLGSPTAMPGPFIPSQSRVSSVLHFTCCWCLHSFSSQVLFSLFGSLPVLEVPGALSGPTSSSLISLLPLCLSSQHNHPEGSGKWGVRGLLLHLFPLHCMVRRSWGGGTGIGSEAPCRLWALTGPWQCIGTKMFTAWSFGCKSIKSTFCS